MKKLLRRILAVLFVVAGCLLGIGGVTYLPALAYPSIATFRIVAYVTVPVLLLFGGVGLFLGKRWSHACLTTAFFVNLLEGAVFLPGLSLFLGLLFQIPFAVFVVVHTINVVIISIAWLSRETDAADQAATPARWLWVVVVLRRASAVAFVVVILVWPLSIVVPIHCAGLFANRFFLRFHADILDIAENRLWLRVYDLGYYFPEPFDIETHGGMPFTTDSTQFTPLQYDWRFCGVRLGYDVQRFPYRSDKAVDVVLPMWLLALVTSPVPVMWLRGRLAGGRRRATIGPESQDS